MAEWSTYSLEDFILFSARVYFRLFEIQNAAFWPLHILLLAFGGALTWVALKRSGIGAVAGSVGLALCWALLGSTFLPRYAAINWAAHTSSRWCGWRSRRSLPRRPSSPSPPTDG